MFENFLRNIARIIHNMEKYRFQIFDLFLEFSCEKSMLRLVTEQKCCIKMSVMLYYINMIQSQIVCLFFAIFTTDLYKMFTICRQKFFLTLAQVYLV